MLTINHLTKTYGGKRAVDDLSLHIAPGEIYGFIGHNGAGKTTTIKACTGIMDFDQGEILVNGTSIKDDPIRCKEQMAYIPDNPDLYEFLSGEKYINFVADLPIQENIILYEAHVGKKVGCNHYAMFKYIYENYPDKFIHVWVVNDDEDILVEIKNKPNIIFVKRLSRIYAYYLMF